MGQESEVRNRLRSIRTRLGLSQQELALAAGVTRQTIGGLEAGHYAPSAAVALRLARALGCRVEELFWLEEELPTLGAVASRKMPCGRSVRVALAEVGGRWIAHPLLGASAFRKEMIPCDGVGDWRDGELRVKLLDDPDHLAGTVALAGCTPVLSLWARAAERWQPGLRVYWSFANSLEALESLACGEVHGAGLHLFDAASGEYNAPFVRRVCGSRPVVLVNLGIWEEGLVVGSGNPKRLARAGDLARPGVRIVNREEGSGSRLLLETLLCEEGVSPAAVDGFERVVHSHMEVAESIAAGTADAGVTSACVAAAYGLEFVPLRETRYDLAFIREYLDHPPVRQLLDTLEHRWVRSQLSLLGGYNTARTGEVVAEVFPHSLPEVSDAI